MYTYKYMRAQYCPPFPFTRVVVLAAMGALIVSSSFAADEISAEVKDPAGDASQSINPADTIRLSEVVALTLARNPFLETFSWDARIGDARILQAGLRPNPELSLEIEDISLGGGPSQRSSSFSLSGLPPVVNWERGNDSDDDSLLGRTELTLSISQLIELGGKRAKNKVG